MALRILLCTSEAVPFAKTGGLADVAGALPLALAELGHDVRLALPKYSAIPDKMAGGKRAGSAFQVPLGGESVEVSVEVSDALPGVPTYLFDCPGYFDRDTLYGQPDDHQRFGLFCRAVLEFLRESDWNPQVIHGNDWQTALVPVFLKTRYADDKQLSQTAAIHTIHNLAYQGVFDPAALDAVGLDRSLFTMNKLEFYGRVNFLKGAVVFADLLNTVSKKYAQEIQTREYGEKLDGILRTRRSEVYGILNGLDYEAWNPATDELIEANYNADDMEGKKACKAALQRRLGLPERPKTPLFGLVSRLAAQKGLDVLAEVIPHIVGLDVQLALLGTGEQHYHDLLSRLAKEHPEKMGLSLAFDNELAHQIYAGADMFLMPSRYEPCGLGQMISLRYGTIPVVRHTGGLADTVDDFDPESGRGNGFSFEEHTGVALLGAMARGLLTYATDSAWTPLVKRAMNEDFSWTRSAQQYADLYQQAISRRGS